MGNFEKTSKIFFFFFLAFTVLQMPCLYCMCVNICQFFFFSRCSVADSAVYSAVATNTEGKVTSKATVCVRSMFSPFHLYLTIFLLSSCPNIGWHFSQDHLEQQRALIFQAKVRGRLWIRLKFKQPFQDHKQQITNNQCHQRKSISVLWLLWMPTHSL